ncbi:tRNA (adenosine(37)-N6)-threonylcarbamoyltransferase complex transferase subunit TsaD [Pelagibacteraceae bacterium]|nr:tRNA (adenosine(37)-N6)-threonylcarbamoyltransferase complex transferase subunit TsaD [Pelagibacteraceae bacterium]
MFNSVKYYTKKNMLVFAAETSCDETSICLMENNAILEHITFSQEIHKIHGGVVPELASRSHLEKIQIITNDLFNNKNIEPKKIDVFTATCGPGLIGSLLVGSTFTKSLAISYNKPFIPTNHLEGHILSTSFNNKIKFPNLILLLTGGHTQVYLMENENKIELLGQSVDDAIGEAFDKTAKLLGLSYPGGSKIEQQAFKGNEDKFILPKPLVKEKNFNFSFSGIKTSVNLLTKKNKIDIKFIEDMSASFQKNITEILIEKLERGLERLSSEDNNIKSISVVGGVSNNKYIRSKMEDFFIKKNIEIYYPIKEMMGDNAAMIAWACMKFYNKDRNDLFFRPTPRLEVRSVL